MPLTSTEPLVSVIMIVKNGEKYLSKAINSVIQQDYNNIEILIIDGHSSDRTAQVAQSYPIVRYFLQKNAGISNAYNLGIRNAKGELITFLSHDDWWELDKISTQVKVLKENPSIQYLVGKARFILEKGIVPPPSYKKEIFDQPIMAFIMETLMVRKSLFNNFEYFNPDYPIGEDIEWFLRTREQDIPYMTLDKVLVNKRVHNSNISANSELYRKLALKMIRESLQRKRQQKIVR